MSRRPKLRYLLAKSFQKGQPWKAIYGYSGHTAAVLESMQILLEHLGAGIHKDFALSQSLESLKQTAYLAAFLHDFGKANDHFQLMVRQKRDPKTQPQLMRHEAISVLLAYGVRDWLQTCPQADVTVAIAAAGGHHLQLGGKNGRCSDEIGDLREGSGTELHLYTDHYHFRGLLQLGVRKLNLSPQIPESFPLHWTWDELRQLRFEVWQHFADWEPDPVFLAVVKALTIAADVSGSALPNQGFELRSWIAEQLQRTLSFADLEQVIQQRLQGKTLRTFQKEMAASQNRVTLVRAGCGGGKTLGAYYWAQHWAQGRKLFFCYPTTGTSTEGFRDYVHQQIAGAQLIHGRAAVDLADLCQTGDEDDLATKLDCCQTWGAPEIVCTVDTVLGLLQCQRRPLYAFPAIAQGAFVFDEVHCYDPRLFGTLLRFLEIVKAPVLLMSASFLPWQRQALEQAVGEPLSIVNGPAEVEAEPRYLFEIQSQPDWDRVQAELASGGKVLWVCNQVSTAIAVYQQARQQGLNPLLYHSRFIYEDRVRHHEQVIQAFRQDKPVLAITTQVAEMSLDLSATLLVSQIAPPPALIQRLGRLNRIYYGQPRQALFYPDPKRLPYSPAQLQLGEQMLRDLETAPVSQAALAKWLEESSQDQGAIDRKASLLDNKWKTYATHLREGDSTLTALLEVQRDRFEQADPRQLPRFTVPLLQSGSIQHWQRWRGLPIAPNSEVTYDPNLGAQNRSSRRSGGNP
ncbi:CRISPR-associated helicase Cas3' [Synechococcus elongatus]|uniref:CRISPR-associated helicase Cas3' n=1 Tax=Synechococcus elongatus TaxID=32046 RepID=UPI000F7EFEE8|nr:CRISPR-associated helicase Cas3' [Synechococcus elongatus]